MAEKNNFLDKRTKTYKNRLKQTDGDKRKILKHGKHFCPKQQ